MSDKDFRKWLLERCERIGYDAIPEHLAPAFAKNSPQLLPSGIIHDWHQYLQEAREIEEDNIRKGELIRSLGIDQSKGGHLATLIIANALAAQSEQCYYLYLKTWDLGGGNCWFKVGVTNDLKRRDREQNVLPVPSTTLLAVRVANEQSARVIEKSIHNTLETSKVLGAQNRELFELEPDALADLITAMKALGEVVNAVI